MINNLILSFLLTLILEYIIIRIITKEKNIFIAVLLVNILTNPFVVFTYNVMGIYYYAYRNIIFYILELLVIIIEGYIYKLLLEIDIKKAMLYSFIANILSLLLGIMINLI